MSDVLIPYTNKKISPPSHYVNSLKFGYSGSVGGTIYPTYLNLFIASGLRNSINQCFNDEIGAYKIKKNVEYVAGKDENGVFMSNESLGILSYGKDIQSARQSFIEDFEHVYELYNALTDDQLSEDVKKIKKLLNSIVVK